ncbi:MAG: HDOD domain-containing protein [Clostridium sp.]
MEIFLARQAIYNREMDVIGYELLYRNSNENRFDPSVGSETATYKVIQNIGGFGFEQLTNNKAAYINFPQVALENNIATLLPRENTIIEVLESVIPTAEVISNLIYIKSLGYKIALDDVSSWTTVIPYINVVDIVKVDMISTELKDRLEIVKYIKEKDRNITLLAEKVETFSELEECKRIGFDQFQGYYFSKPSMLLGKDIQLKNITVYRLLVELLKNDVNIDSIDEIMKSDIVLTYKFLRFINSAYFSFVQEVRSIRQAIMLVGRNEMRKWLSVVAVTQMDNGVSEEYTNNTIIRAKFCELIAEKLGARIDKSSAFLVGLFSEIDLLIKKDMNEVVKELPFKVEVKEALIEKENIYRTVYMISKAYESMDGDIITMNCEQAKLDEDFLGDLYLKAIEWGNKLSIYR